MKRPTVGMACIMKNEIANISTMLQSVRGCFDQIVIVDTGSTDGSVKFLESINQRIEEGSEQWAGLPKIQIEHFEWVNDFSKARAHSFSFLTTDYGAWLDLDDSLSDANAFIHWRDTVMHSAHYWLVNYNYAFNNQGQVECQFIRERVVKMEYGFHWKYFVHEGLVKEDGQQFWAQKVSSWWVNHRRTEEDRKQDYLRNIDILKKYKEHGELEPRMNFYLGKELVENGFQKEGCEPLLAAIKSPSLDIHDRILAIQYAAQSASHCKAYDQAIDLINNGLKLKISRAEYWCLLGDVYCAINRLSDAIQCFKTALNCQPDNMNGIVVVYGYAYDAYPKTKLCELHMAIGDFDSARFWLEELKKINSPSVKDFEPQLMRMVDLSKARSNLTKTTDVVITCPPQAIVTDWDEHSLKEKGHGGSETAAIEVAKWVKLKTGRAVKIFHPRGSRETMPSGVEYIPSSELSGYMQNIEPAAHIMWRHAIKLTNAKSMVWCHDLQLPGGNLSENYDKVMALSEFHKNYLKEVSLVPEEKIVVGFNGVNPIDFPADNYLSSKQPLKVIFSSSPDRGLVEAIDIVKLARETSGLDIKLHCFYGTDNMRKSGQTEWADRIEKHIKDHDFVVYHGMVKKKELMHHFSTAGTWLYTNHFLETFCITAIEAMCAHTWPIVRDIAALPFTLKDAIASECCDMMQVDAVKAHYEEWAHTLVSAIKEEKWQKMNFKAEDYSWEKVADWMIKELDIGSST